MIHVLKYGERISFLVKYDICLVLMEHLTDDDNDVMTKQRWCEWSVWIYLSIC